MISESSIVREDVEASWIVKTNRDERVDNAKSEPMTVLSFTWVRRIEPRKISGDVHTFRDVRPRHERRTPRVRELGVIPVIPRIPLMERDHLQVFREGSM